jgi:hypothetical protein
LGLNRSKGRVWEKTGKRREEAGEWRAGFEEE